MNPFQFILLCWFAPQFRAEMPPDQKGEYLAQAWTFSRFTETLRREKTIQGRRNAYVEARWMALWVDWFTPSEGIGVRWQIVSTQIG